MRLIRRRFIQGAGAIALAPALGLAGRPALAAGEACSGRVVVGTWGGDYQRLLQENIDPLAKAAQLEVVYDVGAALTRQTKMRAERNARRATLDVSLLRDNDMYQMFAEGTTQAIDKALVPNLKHVLPGLSRSYAVPHIFSALVLVYDTEKVKTAPTGLAALLDASLAGRVGVVDDQYDYLTLAGSLASGKGASDLAAGQNFLREFKNNKPKVYPSVDALASALKSGEIWATVTWKARALQWKKAGLPLAFVFPREGALPATFEAAVAAGSRVGACGMGYLNAMLDARAQRAFAETMGYAPTVANAELPPSLAESVGFSRAELDRLAQVDFELLMKNKAALLAFWTKDFRVGL
ncbi:MAG: extracellular solute-binding protein [Comamonadaceae bacterium]|jgi:putative spermidine/putrescine transport system substrate-binding protein|uniref:Extracellular solute-binding protein n=1 Tax=Hydrogenophaga borbori TaxID=2294117 RepID=A0A372EDV7_9BURK|nr:MULTISPECIES: extracellular solute-binding protein [Hydrogenophaga]NCT96173.1 extracellular solute-binding protein [Comamonadaceae bacterium]RFP75569.1 extracellular solute-binding protein [Hydrogenophaga borbori]WQB81582.1 extracellular solute-binding protein [Hydrogenophaga sp. SNF1]